MVIKQTNPFGASFGKICNPCGKPTMSGGDQPRLKIGSNLDFIVVQLYTYFVNK